jgi:CubicO group peptidase (beta-lactamase class C family)
VALLLLHACGGGGSDSSSPFPYTATIQEGRTAANEVMASTGAASISVAFVDGERLVWAETFADPTRDTPTTETMYPICSVSKMIATIAAMRLVDMGSIALDTPLVTYIPSFSMASAGSENITVRMLINHSSGFPGSDYRNAVSYAPLPTSRTYSAQALDTIKTERLKHTPGYMSVYCNDGFTMIEELVYARTGKTYVQFVQDEIFTPLGMTHSAYALNYFPAGSYAKRFQGASTTPLPQVFLNPFASGGLYSTPTDMAKIAMMLAGGGKLGSVRILSASSVAAMGVDQTLASFNPVKSKFLAYGLGWDSVMQPALDSVGVVGWMKTGDFALAGAVIIVVPAERLGVVVIGSSGSFNSGNATAIAERILLRALAEKGRIAAMPVRITATVLPEKAPDAAVLSAAVGYYANNSTFMRVVLNGAAMLDIEKYDPPSPSTPGAWTSVTTGLKYRNDDRFSTDANPSESYTFITADTRQYMVQRSLSGYGYCYDNTITFQKVAGVGALRAAWSARAGKVWLLTNDHPTYTDRWESPVMMLNSLNIPAVGNFYFANTGQLQVVDQSGSDTLATMMLLIPQMQGKELNDVVIETGAMDGWIRWGSYLYCPSDTLAVLANGTVTVTGDVAEWRTLDCTATTTTVTITPSLSTDYWRIYDSSFALKQAGQGTGTATLSGEQFYLIFHATATISGL